MFRLRTAAPYVPCALGLAVLFGAFGGAAACASTSGSESLTPITGVTVRAESLLAGRGCGRGATQLFKYAVIVKSSAPGSDAQRYVAGNVYDCFADGIFVALPSSQGTLFALDVLAYNQADYAALASDPPESIFGRLNQNRAALGVDAGTSARDAALAAITADLGRLRTAKSTAQTHCSAEQVDGVQTLAVCKPLR